MEVALEWPKDEFWEISRHTKRFGDPQTPANNSRGRKIPRCGGYRGVVVPTDDGTGPWHLARARPS